MARPISADLFRRKYRWPNHRARVLGNDHLTHEMVAMPTLTSCLH